MQFYHMLAKVLKFSTTKMQSTNRQSRGLSWVATWAKVGERSEQMFWDCGAKSQEDYGATNK